MAIIREIDGLTGYLERLIEGDCQEGSCQTIDFALEEIIARTRSEEVAKVLRTSKLVQMDLGVGTNYLRRISFLRFEQDDGTSRNLDIWEVDAKGRPLEAIYSINNYPSNNGFHTYISGSSLGSLNGRDLEIISSDLAASLAIALVGLKPNNWKIVV